MDTQYPIPVAPFLIHDRQIFKKKTLSKQMSRNFLSSFKKFDQIEFV